MSRSITVAAAQLGPIQKAEARSVAVERMVRLMDRAHRRGVELVVFPELALTTFFPRHYHADIAEADHWFETAMPSNATAPLFAAARRFGIGFHLGYAEIAEEPDASGTVHKRRFNTSILVNPDGDVMLKYRKVHLPGHAEFDPRRKVQHLEKRYFEVGNLGFPVIRAPMGALPGINMGMLICNDRRWPEAWRVLRLQHAEPQHGSGRVRGASSARVPLAPVDPGGMLPECLFRRGDSEGRHRGRMRTVRPFDHRQSTGRDHGDGDELGRRADHRGLRSGDVPAWPHHDLRVREASQAGGLHADHRTGGRGGTADVDGPSAMKCWDINRVAGWRPPWTEPPPARCRRRPGRARSPARLPRPARRHGGAPCRCSRG
jgi:predicted amidohydrolase